MGITRIGVRPWAVALLCLASTAMLLVGTAQDATVASQPTARGQYCVAWIGRWPVVLPWPSRPAWPRVASHRARFRYGLGLADCDTRPFRGMEALRLDFGLSQGTERRSFVDQLPQLQTDSLPDPLDGGESGVFRYAPPERDGAMVGIVKTPGGHPAKGAEVYLCWEQEPLWAIFTDGVPGTEYLPASLLPVIWTQADTDGRFTFDAQARPARSWPCTTRATRRCSHPTWQRSLWSR